MPLETASFDMHRTLPLAPDRLFEVLTDANHREQWGAPDAEMVLVVDVEDVRVGGQDRHRCGPKEAPHFLVDTRWYDLAAPERAVFTETLIFGGEAAMTSLVTYSLTPSGDGTELAVTVAVSSFTGPDTLDEVRAGWEGGIANLARHVDELTT